MKRIDFAIKMEDDGERYYRDQAALHQGSPLEVVFGHLADAERKHSELLRTRAGQGGFVKPDELPENLFEKLSAYHHEFIANPGQLEVYRMALDLEDKSIELYESMLSETTDDQDRDLLGFLIVQERDHKTLFEELVRRLKRPEEWVEAAEFGRREEY